MGRRLLLVGVCALLMTWVACQGVDFTAPPMSTMTISANPATIPLLGGESTLTISIIEGSSVPSPNGTVVRLTTTLGQLTESRVETKNGLATTKLQSTGIAGTATITAFSGSLSQTIDVTIGVASAGASLTATPATLPVGGGTVSLVATIFGANNSPLAGQSVAFSTSGGTLSSGGQPVVTDSNGVARDTLVTSVTATVTVNAGGTSTATREIVVGTAGALTLVLSADNVNLGSGGGTAQLVAVLLGANGPVVGTAVAWSSSGGSLGTTGVTTTDATGRATNSLTTSTMSTVTVTAAGETKSLVITVGGAVTPVIALSINRTSIPSAPSGVGLCTASGTDPLPLILTALVQDSLGNRLNRDVTFYVDVSRISPCARSFGEFCPLGAPSVTVTATNGLATANYTMTAQDVLFCSCLAPTCNMSACGVTTCPAQCSTTAGGVTTLQDVYCSLKFVAVAGGVESNVQTVEYGR